MKRKYIIPETCIDECYPLALLQAQVTSLRTNVNLHLDGGSTEEARSGSTSLWENDFENNSTYNWDDN